MLRFAATALAIVAALGGCGSATAPSYSSSTTTPGGADGGRRSQAADAAAEGPAPISPVREYQATAPAGDFIRITIDTGASTVSYQDETNGLAARDVPYTVDGTGVYSFAADPNAHLKRAIELAADTLIVDVGRAGPGRDTRSIAIGAASTPMSPGDVPDARLAMMRLRTTGGGFDVGDVVIAGDAGAVSFDFESYRPWAAPTGGGAPFAAGPSTVLAIDGGADGAPLDDLVLAGQASEDGGEGGGVLFATASGLAMDTSGASVLMARQPQAKDFDPSWAGSYRALLFRKLGAAGAGDGGPESGAADVVLAEITVDAAGRLAGADAQGTPILDGVLLAAADVSALTGPGLLDPAHTSGLFTFRTAAADGVEDVFVIFTERGLLAASFTAQAADGGGAYAYWYGAALKR
ncbi:MAG TPA: hypothetical protein VE987_09260 [Polyangiaceae bacterium]|nr:hypothetical protein [Polyangiaceae bacterium]